MDASKFYALMRFEEAAVALRAVMQMDLVDLLGDQTYSFESLRDKLGFTEQGARNIKKSVDRAHAFDQAAEKAGVSIEAQYWTIGDYDGVLIISAEQPENALHCLTELASYGNVTLKTLTAFTDKEFEAIAKD